ncbi:MAG: DUF2726 domain-containing protein [Candidatus Paceibacterota bacterium]
MLIPIIFFIVVILIAVFLVPYLKQPRADSRKESIYKKRSSVMNRSESAFFFELQKQLPHGYYIFPKMRIADILETVSGKGYYHMRNGILPKHIDFLVCDSYFKPIVAIEVNGGYHNNPNQQEKDNVKKEIFKSAGLSFETVNVGSDFSQSIAKIKTNLYAPVQR